MDELIELVKDHRANLALTKEGKESLYRVATAAGMDMSTWVEQMARKEAKKLKRAKKAS